MILLGPALILGTWTQGLISIDLREITRSAAESRQLPIHLTFVDLNTLLGLA
jgi:hypothetical protein